MGVQILYLFLSSIWFILPVYVANMMPVFVKNLNILNFPVDFGKKFINKRIFGDHKTWRGLFFGTLAGGTISLLQRRGFLIGIILGFGALFGDLVGSFIKRRLGIRPGDRALVIDQLPFIVFPLIFSHIVGSLTLNTNQIIFLLIISAIGHPLFCLIGVKLGLKKKL